MIYLMSSHIKCASKGTNEFYQIYLSRKIHYLCERPSYSKQQIKEKQTQTSGKIRISSSIYPS